MTNDTIRAVVITGKYAVQGSPREKRNTLPGTSQTMLQKSKGILPTHQLFWPKQLLSNIAIKIVQLTCNL